MDQEILGGTPFWSLMGMVVTFIVPLLTRLKWKRISLLISSTCFGLAMYLLFSPSITTHWWAAGLYVVGMILIFSVVWRWEISTLAEPPKKSPSLDVKGSTESLREIRDTTGRQVVGNFDKYFSRKFAVLTIANNGDANIQNLIASTKNGELCFWRPERLDPQEFASGNKEFSLLVGQTRQLVIAQAIFPVNAWAELTHDWESETSISAIITGDGYNSAIVAGQKFVNVMRIQVNFKSKELQHNFLVTLVFNRDEPIVHVERSV
jgi:hypothetical protein